MMVTQANVKCYECILLTNEVHITIFSKLIQYNKSTVKLVPVDTSGTSCLRTHSFDVPRTGHCVRSSSLPTTAHGHRVGIDFKIRPISYTTFPGLWTLCLWVWLFSVISNILELLFGALSHIVGLHSTHRSHGTNKTCIKSSMTSFLFFVFSSRLFPLHIAVRHCASCLSIGCLFVVY